MSESDERATGLGQTGGLPGANADDRASELTDDEAADTVGAADVAPPAQTDVDAGKAGTDADAEDRR